MKSRVVWRKNTHGRTSFERQIEFLLHCSLYCQQEGHSDLKRLLKRSIDDILAQGNINATSWSFSRNVAGSPRKETTATVKYRRSFFPSRTRALPTCFKFTSKCHRVRRSGSVMVEPKNTHASRRNAARLSKRFDSFSSGFLHRNSVSAIASELYLSRFSSSLYASGELPAIIGFTIIHCTVRINWCMCSIQIGCTLMGTIKSSYEQVVLPH